MIKELSELTGFSIRTIRYYVQIGLIDPPAGRGRGGFYNDSHVNKLKQIKALQGRGLNLSSIVKYLQGREPEVKDYSRDIWIKYQIIPGIELSVRKDIEEKERKKVSDIVRLAESIAKEDLRNE